MADNDNIEKAQIYTIPENFIDESRIVNGMFVTRNFIEGVVLALIVLPIAFMIPASSMETRIMVIVSVCGPLFLLGNAGFNGDPLSTTLINAYKWFKFREVMLYDNNARSLIKAPLTAMMERELARDKIVDMIENVREKKREKAASTILVEGENFRFAKDRDLEDIRADKYIYVQGYEDKDGNFVVVKNLDEEEGVQYIAPGASGETAKVTQRIYKPRHVDGPMHGNSFEDSASNELDLSSIFPGSGVDGE